MSNLTHVSYADIEHALDWSSSGGADGSQAVICRRTGRVYLRSECGKFEEEELPQDIDNDDLYLPLPHKTDLNLGRDLVFQFVRAKAPELEGRISAAFRQRGAYSKFKSILEQSGLLHKWHEYEAAETRLALNTWAQENGLVFKEARRSDA